MSHWIKKEEWIWLCCMSAKWLLETMLGVELKNMITPPWYNGLLNFTMLFSCSTKDNASFPFLNYHCNIFLKLYGHTLQPMWNFIHKKNNLNFFFFFGLGELITKSNCVRENLGSKLSSYHYKPKLYANPTITHRS